VLGLGAQAMVWQGEVPGNRAAMSMLFLLVGWPLIVRRRYPLIPIAFLMGALSVQALATSDATEGLALLLTGLVSIYSVAAWGSRRIAVTGLAVAAVGGTIVSLEDQHMRTGEQLWSGLFFYLAWIAAWIAGLAVRAHRTARLAEQQTAEAERRHAGTVTAERSRIARELHDVIAHNVSVIVLQAVAAQGVLDGEPDRVRDPLSRIEESGREALDELRRLVGVMRDTDGARDLEPQPGLADMTALTDTVRAAGLQVELTTEGLTAPLPRAIDLSAYRIIHEGTHQHPQARRSSHRAGEHLPIRNCARGRGHRRRPWPRDPNERRRARARRDARTRRPLQRLGRSRNACRGRLPRPCPAPAGARLTTVVIADDQALVRDGFRVILEVEPDIDVIGEAADGIDAVEQTRRLAPDVILMDIRMPRLDGIAATRKIVAAAAATHVLILTTFDGDEFLYDAMRAGASGFLAKDVRRDQLVDAIRTVDRGDALLGPSLVRRLIEDFCSRPAPQSAGRPAALADLTDRELQVLELVARGHSNAEIATELFLSEATIKTHLAHLTRKLGLHDRVQAVILAYESGLVQPGTTPP
jgi:DNA-binding NarL/FixJ family response regulator/signal transduction histidine kinase